MNPIDDYLAGFSGPTRDALDVVRATVLEQCPDDAEQVISYQIPTIRVDGRAVVHFAGWNSHMSLYPVPEGDADYHQAIEPFRAGKGTLKFPTSTAMPVDVVARTVQLLLERH